MIHAFSCSSLLRQQALFPLTKNYGCGFIPSQIYFHSFFHVIAPKINPVIGNDINLSH